MNSFPSYSTLFSTYWVYLWLFSSTIDCDRLLLPVCLVSNWTVSQAVASLHILLHTAFPPNHLSAMHYSKIVFAMGFQSNQGGWPHDWAWVRMTLLGHSYALLMVLPLPLTFTLSWILLFTQNNLDFVTVQLERRASKHRAAGRAGGHTGTVAGRISLVSIPGRREI